MNNTSADQIRSFVERIETLEQQKKDISDDIRSVLQEAKGEGFDPKILKIVVRLRNRNKDDVDNEEALLELYKEAVGL